MISDLPWSHLGACKSHEEFGPKIVRADFSLDRLTGKLSQLLLTIHIGPRPVRTLTSRATLMKSQHCTDRDVAATVTGPRPHYKWEETLNEREHNATVIPHYWPHCNVFSLPHFTALHPYPTLVFFPQVCVH